jgi:hypothetical protein
MSTDVEMTGVAPITGHGELPPPSVVDAPITGDGKLEPPSVVELWTAQKLLERKEIQNILQDDTDQTTFRNARISGKAFLLCGDDRHFWTGDCHLPAGPSVELADLVQTIKNMGKDKSRGNASTPPLHVKREVDRRSISS